MNISNKNSLTPVGQEQLIERMSLSSMLNPGEQWQPHKHHGRHFTLEYWLRFRCDTNYYGPLCNKFCRGRDDFFGHFDCDMAGSKVCKDGWTGPQCSLGELIFSALMLGHHFYLFIFNFFVKADCTLALMKGSSEACERRRNLRV